MQIVHSMDKLGILWHRLPVFVGLFYLGLRRHLHQEYNLFNVGKTPAGVRFNPADYPYRTANGEYNDPFNEGAGSEGTFFGRNILPADQKQKVYTCISNNNINNDICTNCFTNFHEQFKAAAYVT